MKSVQYGNIVAPLIEAVKEQQTEIEALQQENQTLKAQVAKIELLEKQMAQLLKQQQVNTTTTAQNK